MRKRELEKIRAMLAGKRDALARRIRAGLSEIEAGEGGHHLADLEEMDNVEDKDAVFEIVNSEAETLERIDKALEGIDRGTYGICEDCGQEIGFERLEALPFATQCIECKKKEEEAKS